MVQKKKSGIWNLIDKIEGDKVIWMIVFLLIMISVLAISSSTSLLAANTRTTRVEIIKTQTLVVMAGLAVIFICYYIKSLKFFLHCSKLGFAVSALLLGLLTMHVDLPFIKAQNINHAWRTLSVFGFQVHVFEIVKIAMVMYLSWAVWAYNRDQNPRKGKDERYFGLARWMETRLHMSFMAKPIAKRIFYFYLPIAITCIGVQQGSNSSLMIIGPIMVATLLLGGMSLKKMFAAVLVLLVMVAGTFGLYKISDGKLFGRIETGISRVTNKLDENSLAQAKDKTEYYEILDEIRQPFGAKVAIKEGGFWGKGPGGSTQKYTVSVMFGDYMYSFLLEEYGLWGGILVIILYVSLLARGSMIARMCGDNDFAKSAVGGLTLLITAQAFLHMFINVGIGPLTGQTLPLISHGTSSFLMFSLAFGIILSISRIAKKEMEKEEAAAVPIYQHPEDEVHSSLTELDQMEDSIDNYSEDK